jgi:hypothetical protein
MDLFSRFFSRPKAETEVALEVGLTGQPFEVHAHGDHPVRKARAVARMERLRQAIAQHHANGEQHLTVQHEVELKKLEAVHG